MNKVILLAAIFIALVCFVSTTPVLWTWSNLREKEMELEGRTGIKVAESSKYCQDARQCRSSQFHYDFYSLHCYKTRNLATQEISAVKYKNYSPMSPKVSTCVNLGGEAVTGTYGYMFQKDEVSAADYFNIDTEEDYTFSVGETLSTNEPITNAGMRLKVYQSGSLLGQGLHYVSFPGSEYYLFQMFFALIDNEDSGSMFDINLTGSDGTVLSLRWGDGMYNIKKSYSAFYVAVTLQSKQGKQLTYRGKTINLDERSAALLSLNSTRKVYMNGYCVIRFHKCNQFCNNPEQCNKLTGCVYDVKKSHCVQK